MVDLNIGAIDGFPRGGDEASPRGKSRFPGNFLKIKLIIRNMEKVNLKVLLI